MSDNMRLVARVEDQFTGPLAKLKHGIVDVSDTTKKHTGAWRKDWDEARGGVTRFQGALTEVTPVLSRLGVTGVGAALSIGGVAGSLNNFTSKTRDLSQTAKDIGFTVDQLRTFQALGQRFGMSADTMTGALRNLAGQMYEVKRQGTTFVELQAMNLGKLAGELAKAASPQEFLEKLMEGIRSIPDNEVKRRVSRLMFGTDDISIVVQGLTGPIKGAFAEVSTSIGKMSKETEQAAKEFQGHMSDIQEWYDRTYLKVMGPLAKGVSGLIKDFEKNGLSGNEQEQATRRALSPFGGDGPTPREKLEGRRNSVQQQLDLLDKNPDAADYRRKRDRMVDELRRVGDELERLRQQGGGATLSPSSFGGPAGGGSLIQKAAWGGGGFGGGPLSSYGGGGSGSAFGAPSFSGGTAGSPGMGGPAISPRAPVPYQGAINKRRGGAREEQDGPLAAKYPDGLAAGIRQTAKDLGVSAEDIATVLSYETGGTFDKWKRGPTTKWGTHRGLIQWGEPQAQKYGVTADMSAGEQMRAVTRYLRDAGVKPGMGILDIYSAVNAGRVGRYNASDAAAGGAWGTVRDKVEHQMHGHRRKAAALLRTEPDGDIASGAGGEADVPWYQRPRSNEPGKMSRLRDDELEVHGSGERPGDRMMRRFYGEGAPVAKGGKGSLHITLEGFPPGSKAKASMDDLFRDTKVERARSQMDMI